MLTEEHAKLNRELMKSIENRLSKHCMEEALMIKSYWTNR